MYNNILRVKSPEHLGLPLGGYEETRARLRKERHQDYLRYLASKLKAVTHNMLLLVLLLVTVEMMFWNVLDFIHVAIFFCD